MMYNFPQDLDRYTYIAYPRVLLLQRVERLENFWKFFELILYFILFYDDVQFFTRFGQESLENPELIYFLFYFILFCYNDIHFPRDSNKYTYI